MALSSTSTDADVVAAYENSARYWESYAKACDFCEACTILLNRFARMNAIGGRSWTREDLNKELDAAKQSRIALAPQSGVGARTYFARARFIQ